MLWSEHIFIEVFINNFKHFHKFDDRPRLMCSSNLLRRTILCSEAQLKSRWNLAKDEKWYHIFWRKCSNSFMLKNNVGFRSLQAGTCKKSLQVIRLHKWQNYSFRCDDVQYYITYHSGLLFTHYNQLCHLVNKGGLESLAYSEMLKTRAVWATTYIRRPPAKKLGHYTNTI